MLSDDTIRSLPKAVLHDHLDGGLRPQTILELADTVGYQGLPATDAASLGTWFRDSADSGSLERYLETFDQTLAVMQTEAGLHRVASECVQDLAADGVVYAEVRFAPELHVEAGLDLAEVVRAVLAGFAEGERRAAAAGRRIVVRALLTAMRHASRSREIAELVVAFRDEGVVGFDIAGAEERVRRPLLPDGRRHGGPAGPALRPRLLRPGAERGGVRRPGLPPLLHGPAAAPGREPVGVGGRPAGRARR